MIRTVVCEKEGCSGNEFLIESKDNEIVLKCSNCKQEHEIKLMVEDYKLVSNCSKCDNDKFKIFRDTENNEIYIKCIRCSGVPEKLYFDSDGNNVSYEIKLLNDVKNIINVLDQRVCSLESELRNIEVGQMTLEESIAYVNKFLLEKV